MMNFTYFCRYQNLLLCCPILPKTRTGFNRILLELKISSTGIELDVTEKLKLFETNAFIKKKCVFYFTIKHQWSRVRWEFDTLPLLREPFHESPFVTLIFCVFSGGRLCSFSPCIEQVQRTCVVLNESGCFEDIETVELIHKPYKVRRTNLPIVNIGLSDPDVRKVLCEDRQILPCAYDLGDSLPVGVVAVPSEMNGDATIQHAKKRKLDSDKASAVDEKAKAISEDAVTTTSPAEQSNPRVPVLTPPSFTKNAFSSKSCMAPKEIYGHTGYLTFATYIQ